MRPNALISVIIVNYNGIDFIEPCLRSVYNQCLTDFEVIVVDNNSTDGSPGLITKLFPSVELHVLKKNVGFAQGNNYGFEKSQGQFILLLNPDTVLRDQTCLSHLHRQFECSEIGAVAPKILLEFDRSRLDSAGTEFNNLGFNWGRGFLEEDGEQFAQSQEVFGATACAMMFRRHIIPSPLFDPSFFMYYEELELSIRVREEGYKIVYIPEAVVYHKLSASQNKTPSIAPTPFKQFHANMNRTKVFFRYFPFGIICRNLFLFILSLAYWQYFFLKSKAYRYFICAPFLQLKAAVVGLKHRNTANKSWCAFMIQHSLSDLVNHSQRKNCPSPGK